MGSQSQTRLSGKQFHFSRVGNLDETGLIKRPYSTGYSDDIAGGITSQGGPLRAPPHPPRTFSEPLGKETFSLCLGFLKLSGDAAERYPQLHLNKVCLRKEPKHRKANQREGMLKTYSHLRPKPVLPGRCSFSGH